MTRTAAEMKITRTYWLAHYGGDRPAEVAWDIRPSGPHRPHLRAITGPHTVTFTEGDGLGLPQ